MTPEVRGEIARAFEAEARVAPSAAETARLKAVAADVRTWDVRLLIHRPDGGTVRVLVTPVGQTPARVVVGRYDSDGKPVVRQAFSPEDLDQLIDALVRCRCVLLGVPDPKEEAKAAQEAAGVRRRAPKRVSGTA